MSVRHNRSGAMIAFESTAYGDYRVEFPANYDGPVYDAEGREVGRVKIAIKHPDPPVSTIGDRFAAALHDRLGGVPCGACKAEQQRLNTLTAEQVTAQRDGIIEATVRRATNHPRWRTRIAAKIGDAIAPGVMRQIIGECLDEATIATE